MPNPTPSPDPCIAEAIHLLATALLRHLAHTHGLNESVLTRERKLTVDSPDQSSPDPETPPTWGAGEHL